MERSGSLSAGIDSWEPSVALTTTLLDIRNLKTRSAIWPASTVSSAVCFSICFDTGIGIFLVRNWGRTSELQVDARYYCGLRLDCFFSSSNMYVGVGVLCCAWINFISRKGNILYGSWKPPS